MRQCQVWLQGLLIAMLVLPISVFAAPQMELLEEVPSPPKVIEGQPMEEPQVTIRKKGEDTIEEYRINGEMYMMKVTPKSGKPYFLHKEDPNGAWVNIGPNPPLSVPHWILFRF